MKANLFFIILIAIFPVQDALSNDLLKSIQSLNTFDSPKARSEASAYMAATDQVLHAWKTATEDDKMRFATKVFLVHFRRAELLAASGNFAAAASELTEEANIQKVYGGRIEFATKSPDAFFRDLVELQANVTAETGSDPLAGRVGYSFEKDGDGFIAARLELGDDIAGITVPEIGADEALASVHRLNRQGGKFVATASRWLVVPKGLLPDVLNQATREVSFDSSGKMMVHRLQAQGEASPKVNPSAATNTTNPQVPFPVQPAAPSASEAKHTTPTPDEEPASSTPWIIITVLIVAATSLLWLLLKRRL